ncbi:hypothetical protein GGF49_003682 [Coemansia sp. RSA 1853]|nr:hypothetical protein GGF49_003682 [Coemansia sp. RSA 1853]
MEGSEGDSDRRRLICLDTESSICLSFDKSLYDGNMPLAPLNSKSIDAKHSKLIDPAYRKPNDTVQPISAHERQFIPRVHEFNESSDRHIIPRVQQINGSDDNQHQRVNRKDVVSASSNDESMATADMVLSDIDDSSANAQDSLTDFDRDLQAAVDLMLQGSTSPSMHHAYNMGNMSLVGGFNPSSAANMHEFGSSTEELRPKLPRRIFDRGRLLSAQLGTKITERFKRRNDNGEDPGIIIDDRRDVSAEIDGEETKRMVDDSLSDEINGKPTKCTDCVPPGSASTSRVARLVSPIVRYMQRRPMASLGIVLGMLVALLVVIIIILVVGVFPFLMRSTLQDVSFEVTSVHASAPAAVSRVLKLKHKLHDKMFRGVVPQALHKRDTDAVGPHSLVLGSVKHVVPPVAVNHVLAPPAMHAEGAQHVGVASPPHLVSPVAHALLPNLPGPASNRAIGAHPHVSQQDDAVTITRVSMSTLHVAPHQPTLSPTTPVSSPEFKALDANLPPLTYSMQIGGNLTSGGPIGVDIEFTEPLRMYWRDTEVGSIDKPNGIHVPGRGTTPWSWPAFDMTVSQAPVISGNRKLENTRALAHGPSGSSEFDSEQEVDYGAGTGVAQRRVMGGTPMLGRAAAEDMDVQGNLADWFAAIQSHRSFTMQWRSRVRVSAMGLHSNNIKFEKTVRITCDNNKDCVISQ